MTDSAVRPFEVLVPDDDLAGLRRRIAATRWPPRQTITDQSQGVQSSAIQNLITYWGTGYHWRGCEAKLKRAPAVHDRNRRQPGLQERDQDLIPLRLAGEHPADVVARFGFESADP
jgi:Epoxide hydrolase N terminus